MGLFNYFGVWVLVVEYCEVLNIVVGEYLFGVGCFVGVVGVPLALRCWCIWCKLWLWRGWGMRGFSLVW